MLQMGEKRYRVKEHGHYQVRKLKDQGKSIPQISLKLSLKPKRVFKLLHTDISRILSPEQKLILSASRKTPRSSPPAGPPHRWYSSILEIPYPLVLYTAA